MSDQVITVGPTAISGIGTGQGDKGMCPLVGRPWSAPAQGCWQYYSGTSGNPLNIADRENVVNLHMGIPKRNGLRDDVQLLWSGSALTNYFVESPSDLGPGVNQFAYSAFGTNYHAPICGPETIAPGLTVNGCNSPIGPAGQIIPLQGLGGPFICGSPTTSGGINTLGCGPTYAHYADGVAYNVPFGSPIATSAASVRAPGVYMAPDTPAHAFDGPLPLYDNSLTTIRNDTGITKIQYTYALSQSAYLRAYGYTFYSDWMQVNPIYAGTGGGVPTNGAAAQYDLYTHTSGGALDFQDQLNDQNLISLSGNYSTASVIRFNNSSAFGPDSPIGYMSSNGKGGYTCYDPGSGAAQPCLAAGSYWSPTANSGKGGSVAPSWTSFATVGPFCPTTSLGCAGGFAAAGTPAAKAGATWDSLWSGNASGSYNTVRPEFTNFSLQDQFRPSDKLLINAAIRYDDFTYKLPDSVSAADNFYAAMTANYTCVKASTSQVLTSPLPPGVPPPASAQYVVGDCNAAVNQLQQITNASGWVHPNGKTQDGVAAPNFTAASPSSYPLNYWEPRFSATYTLSPDTVIRASAGRFTAPPISASVQYLSSTGDDRSVWNNTMNLGFYTPFHPIPGISSGQYDLSLEQHFRGTDMSFKLTPFYTWVSNWQQQTFIGSNFVTQVPVGVNRIEGVEFQFNKGDFTRNGLSGQLAFTYTNSKVMFQQVGIQGGVVPNELAVLNQVIGQYNKLTKGGGGSACYQNGLPSACTAKPIQCGTSSAPRTCDPILNPYYNLPEQGLLGLSSWYNPFSTAIAPSLNGGIASYISPITSALLLNYRKDKLAITPTFSFQTGGYYGSPLDTNGIDPRTCSLNQRGSHIASGNPLACNYLTAVAPGLSSFGYLYVPNPQTGSFLFDNVQSPSSIVGNLQIAYDLSPKIKLTVLGVNLFHACFGGTTEPWTSAYPPSNNVCGYSPAGGVLNSSLYPSNFYNGSGINDFAANHARVPAAFQQSYTAGGTNNGALGAAPQPISVYFNAQIRI